MTSNIILLTGRGGSKSVPGKNVYPVLGRPLAFYPMNAAKKAKRADSIHVSTDCKEVIQVAAEMDINIIERPKEMSEDDSELITAIEHAIAEIGEDINYLITMHCNCGVHREGLIDEAIQVLDDYPEADSCVSGYIDHSVHPYRTKRIEQDGTLSPWLDIPEGTTTNRQGLAPCFILDGAVRVMRYKTCFPPRGQKPFTYLGREIRYLENSEGGDVHSMKDIATTEFLLKEMGWLCPR